jgi:hypothetical protein
LGVAAHDKAGVIAGFFIGAIGLIARGQGVFV